MMHLLRREMKLSVLMTIITATSMVRGAALKTHADAGADQQLRNGTRAHAGIPLISKLKLLDSASATHHAETKLL